MTMRPSILRDQRGIALFLVLWVLTLLMVIVGEFCYTMRTEIKITRNFMEQTKAMAIAEGGVFRTIAGLINKKNEAKRGIASSEIQDKEEQVFRINIEPAPMALGDGVYRVRIDNEAGKINLNKAEIGLLRLAFTGLELDPTEENIIIDSIIDWRDTDTLHRLNGAEDDYYQALAEPYDCKDGPFSSVDELLLVRGITLEILNNGPRDLLTVLPIEKNNEPKLTPRQKAQRKRKNSTTPSTFNYQKICLNAASEKMLSALPLMNEDLAREVIAYREEKDFISLGEIHEIVGPDVYRQVLPYLTLQLSPFYTLKAVGEIDDSRTKKMVHAMVMLDEKSERRYRLLHWIE